jgi:hypothetical protein
VQCRVYQCLYYRLYVCACVSLSDRKFIYVQPGHCGSKPSKPYSLGPCYCGALQEPAGGGAGAGRRASRV